MRAGASSSSSPSVCRPAVAVAVARCSGRGRGLDRGLDRGRGRGCSLRAAVAVASPSPSPSPSGPAVARALSAAAVPAAACRLDNHGWAGHRAVAVPHPRLYAGPLAWPPPPGRQKRASRRPATRRPPPCRPDTAPGHPRPATARGWRCWPLVTLRSRAGRPDPCGPAPRAAPADSRRRFIPSRLHHAIT